MMSEEDPLKQEIEEIKAKIDKLEAKIDKLEAEKAEWKENAEKVEENGKESFWKRYDCADQQLSSLQNQLASLQNRLDRKEASGLEAQMAGLEFSDKTTDEQMLKTLEQIALSEAQMERIEPVDPNAVIEFRAMITANVKLPAEWKRDVPKGWSKEGKDSNAEDVDVYAILNMIASWFANSAKIRVAKA
jgi:chromosome segregation ATPase